MAAASEMSVGIPNMGRLYDSFAWDCLPVNRTDTSRFRCCSEDIETGPHSASSSRRSAPEHTLPRGVVNERNVGAARFLAQTDDQKKFDPYIRRGPKELLLLLLLLPLRRSPADPGYSPFLPCYMWRWLRSPLFSLPKTVLELEESACDRKKDDDTLRRARSIELRKIKIKKYNEKYLYVTQRRGTCCRQVKTDGQSP